MGRVNTDIFRVLTTALRDKIKDENLSEVHILRVDTAPNLDTARVFINTGAKQMEALNGFFRNEIAQNLKIRKVPTLRFIVDEGGKNTVRVEELLKQIKTTEHRGDA